MKLGFIVKGWLLFADIAFVLAAGKETQVEVDSPPEGLSWEEWHMLEEHNMETYTPEDFFMAHDLGSKGFFDSNDILDMYGLNREIVVGKGNGMGKHDNSEVIDPELRKRVVALIMRLLDVDDDTKITKSEYLAFAKAGNQFPDLGVGVGHSSSFEDEYEIHHWNKYHKDQDPDIKNVHKEDIEHELLHHEHEIDHEDRSVVGAAKGTVITDDELENRIELSRIPSKFKNGLF